MKAKVKSIKGDGKFKELFKYEIELDNGEFGKIYKKNSDSGLYEGQEIEYEINDKGTLKVFTEFEKKYKSRGGQLIKYPSTKDELIVRQSSLKCAVDFVIANGGDSDAVIKLAEKFTQYVIQEDYKPTNVTPKTDDLPF